MRAGRLTQAEAHGAWEAGRAFMADAPVDPGAVLDAAFARGLSGYDAEFVALAESLSAPLVTDDQRVLAACPGVAVSIDDYGAAPPAS